MPDKSQLLYHINSFTNVDRHCTLLFMAPDILVVIHGKGHLEFSRCYKIITCSSFIYDLTKLFCTFICHCPKYLALQTRQLAPYGSLQPIELSLILFFTPTLDFVLALSLSKAECNAIMSVTCKFSKRVTLIEGADTWLSEQWVHAFLNKLDLIDWGLLGELITNWDPKFLSKFCTALFTNLGIKLLYSTTYHPQTNGSTEHINQTVEIALRFFVHIINNPFCWLKVLPRIQSLLNNTFSSITRKTSNEITYKFSLGRPLDLCFAVPCPTLTLSVPKSLTQYLLYLQIKKSITTEGTNLYLWTLEIRLYSSFIKATWSFPPLE